MREGEVPLLLKTILPPLVGGLLAFLVSFGLVWSQTQEPDENPASQPILVYGD